MAYSFCLLGFTDEELAKEFEVSRRTLNEWKTKYPDFLHSLKSGKSIADGEVAKSLYKRAMGYKGKAIKFATFEGRITDQLEYEAEYPPDTTAAIFWLKNRQPGKWREKHEDKAESGNLIIELALPPEDSFDG